MITYSIIKKSQLEGAHRLDAEYYQPEFLNLISKIKSQKSKTLAEIGEIVYGTTPLGGVFEESGIPFIRSQNFSNLLIDESSIVFCSDKFHSQNRKSEIRPGDILFAAVGATIGEVAVVQDKIEKGNINQNIARVRILDDAVEPHFAGVFFASHPGQSQIERLTTGNAQPYLNSEQIGLLSIPILDKKEQNGIRELFFEVSQSIENSKSLYSQAENLLLGELGLKDFKADEDLYSIVNFSDIKTADRIDAEYFQPKYEKLMSLIRANKGIALGELASIKKGFEPGSEAYQEEGKLFIRVSSLSKDGITDKDQKYLKDDLYKKLKKDYEPKVGEILLTKDATPGVAYTVKEPIEGIIAGGILRLKIEEDIEPEYLALVINSFVGQAQVERDAGGSVIAHWKPDQVKELRIPVLPQPIQQKIAGLVRQSHEARKKAKALLEEAKQKVERLIERIK